MKVVAALLLAMSVASRVAFAQGATIEVAPPGTAQAGATVTVKWSGPNGPGDYVTVARQGADPFAYLNYKLTSDGRAPVNPVSLVLPAEPGAYEIRYVTGTPRRVLAAVPYAVTRIVATLEGPANVAPDSRFEVAWLGPNNGGDFVTIVAAGSAPRAYGSYVDARTGRVDEKTGRHLATLRAPVKPGQYELRYVQQGSQVIGVRAIDVTTTSPLTVIPVAPTLMAPSTSVSGLKPTTGGAVISSKQCSMTSTAPQFSATPGGVTFTFAPTAGTTGYRISRSDLGELTPIAVPGPSYTHASALFASTTYQYAIRSEQADGGCTTVAVSVTPPRPLTPQVTATLTATGVRLSWSGRADRPTDYLILGPGLPATGTEVPASTNPTGQSFDIGNLATGTHTWLVTPLWKTPTGIMSDVALGGRATATVGSVAPRTITLTGFTGAGTAVIILPRTITVSGFTGMGTAVVIPPRTITVTGWTGTGTATQGVIIR